MHAVESALVSELTLAMFVELEMDLLAICELRQTNAIYLYGKYVQGTLMNWYSEDAQRSKQSKRFECFDMKVYNWTQLSNCPYLKKSRIYGFCECMQIVLALSAVWTFLVQVFK